jgi:hypothetical protein
MNTTTSVITAAATRKFPFVDRRWPVIYYL